MRRNLFLTIPAMALAACASSQASREPTTSASPATAESSGMQGEGMRGGMAGMCPMQVEGTTVRAADVEGGVALTFTTSGDVAELRRRVAHMAEMHGHHGEHHGHGMGMHGQSSGGGGEHAHGAQQGGAGQPQSGQHQGGMMMGGGMMMPAATARTEEIDGGARVILTPRDPADLGKLREHAQHMAERMASGQCPMMERSAEESAPAPTLPPTSPEDHDSHHPEGGD